MKNHYATLNVSETSDEVVIRAAFKALMLKYHPDTNRSVDATARAAEINEAFAVLSNPAKRRTYDEARRASQGGPRSSPPAPPPPPPPPPSPPSQNNDAAERRPAIYKSPGRVWHVVVLIGLIFGGLSFLPKAQEYGAAQSEQTPSTDQLADNLEMQADNMEAMANASQVAASTEPSGVLTGAALDSYTASLRALGDQQNSALNFADLEESAHTFVRVLNRRGISGARQWSQNCHVKAAAAPTYAALDRCAAFDLSARYLDEQVTKEAGTPNAYFAFQAENQGDLYKALDLMPYFANERLAKIKNAVVPVTYEAIMSTFKPEPEPTPEASSNQVM